MVGGLPITNIDWILQQLVDNLFGSYTLLAIYIIFFAVLICMANDIPLMLGLIISVPMLAGMIGIGILPNIFWVIPILISSVLWIGVAYIFLGISKR